jgi:hypothetical protein
VARAALRAVKESLRAGRVLRSGQSAPRGRRGGGSARLTARKAGPRAGAEDGRVERLKKSQAARCRALGPLAIALAWTSLLGGCVVTPGRASDIWALTIAIDPQNSS